MKQILEAKFGRVWLALLGVSVVFAIIPDTAAVGIVFAVGLMIPGGWRLVIGRRKNGGRQRSGALLYASVAVLALGAVQMPATETAVAPEPSAEATAPLTPVSTPTPEATPTPTPSATPTPKPSKTTSTPKEKAASGSAAKALETLPIKGRAPKTGYSRDQFGPSWADVDRNGCDTRNDILHRDLSDKTYKPGTYECVVLTGILNDPYTATQISFQRGQQTSTAVQIDHVVALSDAWQKGAQQLSEEQRWQFANDPYNLLAVDGPANQHKSDGDAATWLPANKGFRCEYVARQIGVKQKYSLWVTQAEHDAMATVLSSCPDQRKPEGGGAKVKPKGKQIAPAPTKTKAPAPAKEQAPAPNTEVYYKNCTAAREAGAAPIYSGERGYSSHLDRDGDGIACE